MARLLLVLVAVLAVGFAYVLTFPVVAPDSVIAPSRVQSSTAAGAGDKDAARPDPARYAAIVERPLFVPERRPTGPAVEYSGTQRAAASPDPLAAFTLSAVTLSPDRAIAVVVDTRTGRALRLRRGDSLGGWTVTGMSALRVEFARAGAGAALVMARGSSTEPTTATSRPYEKRQKSEATSAPGAGVKPQPEPGVQPAGILPPQVPASAPAAHHNTADVLAPDHATDVSAPDDEHAQQVLEGLKREVIP